MSTEELPATTRDDWEAAVGELAPRKGSVVDALMTCDAHLRARIVELEHQVAELKAELKQLRNEHKLARRV